MKSLVLKTVLISGTLLVGFLAVLLFLFSILPVKVPVVIQVYWLANENAGIFIRAQYTFRRLAVSISRVRLLYFECCEKRARVRSET